MDNLHQPVVRREEWLQARKILLKQEKALTRMRDLLAAERRRLPWVRVEKDYFFDSPRGQLTLRELFKGRSQLIVQHFMLAPGWEAGCTGCSFCADHAEPAVVHLENHDVAYVRVSRAPLPTIENYRKRMGWQADWVSSFNSDFNFDFGVSFTAQQLETGGVDYNYGRIDDLRYISEELPGHSVFYCNDRGEVFHTYSSFARGNEEAISTFIYLDMTPKGRNEESTMDWVRRHDEYDNQPAAACCQQATA